VTLEERIGAFHKLGRLLDSYIKYATDRTCKKKTTGLIKDSEYTSTFENIDHTIEEAIFINPWFTRQNILFSLSEIARVLTESNLVKWLSPYPGRELEKEHPKKIGVILAGNIPLVGFHDFLSILMCGHRFIGKLSSKDDKLLPLLGTLLSDFNGEFSTFIEFEENRLKDIDAIIATGSNNTFRYFEYYFGGYPHIFRKNRNGVAVINGTETVKQLTDLAEDIFTYFGLGCRSVSKLFVPEHYQFKTFFEAIEKYNYLVEHNKYMNNYTYYRSVYLLNKIPYLDNGFLILKQDVSHQSPIACLFYEFYDSTEKVSNKLIRDKNLIQCVVGEELPGVETVPAGHSQHPELWDFADHIDTIDFLVNLGKKTGNGL
jgi:hypothetical protein